MSDETLRLLERRAKSSGDEHDVSKFLAELERCGDENGARVAKARYLGRFEKNVVYVVEDLQVKFTVYNRKREKTSVVFSHNQPDPDMERPPYGGQRGDGSELSRLWRIYNRLELKSMRAQILRGFRLLGIELPGKTDAQKLPFDAYAGCSSCRCSSGFLPPAVKLALVGCSESYRARLDVFVTRIDTPEEAAAKAARRKALKKKPRKKRKAVAV
jgi:hypothetical protein